MPSVEFQNGLLCGMFIHALPLGSGEGTLPDGDKLEIINCDYYRGEWGEGVAYLNPDTFTTVFSSEYYYTPTSGIVMMGAFELIDWDDMSGIRAEAILKIIIDGATYYEGDIYQYFQVEDPQPLKKVKAFTYKESFYIQAKRTNLTNAMALEIYQTFIRVLKA